jgi:hypothetical protein
MSFQVYLRRAGRSALECAVRMAPPEVKEWGEAILAELNHIEDSWAAFLWSWGGAAIIAQRTLIAWIFQNRNLTDTGLREGTMRKATSWIAGSCVVAVLLFLLFPVFRQAVGISITPWVRVFQSRDSMTNEDSELQKLAKEAEAKQDAEAMAFVAIKRWNSDESVRLADEAVRLDPNLTWIYSGVAPFSRHSKDQWIIKLQKWDPQNAYPRIMAAQLREIRYFYEHGHFLMSDQRDDQWKSIMASAFQAEKFDDYFSKRIELDRHVAQRYPWLNPLTILGDQRLYWSGYGAGYILAYSKLLVEEGDKLEAAGKDNLAEQNYLSVVRFGQLLRNQERNWHDRETFLAAEIQAKAFEGLKSLADKKNNRTESANYASRIQALKREMNFLKFSPLPWDIYRSNASIVQMSGLFLAFFSIIILVSLLNIIQTLAFSRSFSNLGKSASLIWLSIGSAGLLLSSVALYAGYQRYAHAFDQFVLQGNINRIDYFGLYESLHTLPLGLQTSYDHGFLRLYAWYGVTAVLLCTLVIWGLRIFTSRNRVTVPA